MFAMCLCGAMIVGIFFYFGANRTWMVENQLNRCDKLNKTWTKVEQNLNRTEQKVNKSWTIPEQKLKIIMSA